MRAFTTRRRQPEAGNTSPLFIGRAASMRAGRPVIRAKISSPVALVSTSNALLNHAEDIIGTTPIEIRSVSPGSSASSTNGDDSDASSNSIHSSETVTDASSVDESPSPIEPNHLSCYFKPAVDTQTKSPSRSPSISARPSFDAPRIPQRVPSHSKKAHETLHRKRSVQRIMSPPSTSYGESARARSSADMFSSAFVEAPKESPFGNELAQLQEVAEEFGQVVCNAEADEEAMFLQSHGLAHFAASDYMSEIQSLIYETFGDEHTAAQAFGGWI